MNNPWETEEGKKVWKTKAEFFNYIRGGLRRGLWMRHPLKLQLIRDKRVRVPFGRVTASNPEGLVWGCKCELCLGDFKSGDIQVDHINGNVSLKTSEDLKDFIIKTAFVTSDDLQIVCKKCHKIKTHSESRGITFEEAAVEKEVIEIIKAKKDKTFLLSKGIEPSGNAKGRREQIIKYISKGSK